MLSNKVALLFLMSITANLDETDAQQVNISLGATPEPISKLAGNLRLSFNGNILNLDSTDVEQKVSDFLFDEPLTERAKVWKLMAELNDKIAAKNNISVQRSYRNLEDVAGQMDDIVLDKEDVEEILEAIRQDPELVSFRSNNLPLAGAPGIPISAGLASDKRKWDLPIKYKIRSSAIRAVVKAAIAVWERETCIRFQERNALIIFGPNIVFRSNKKGCWSKIGKKPITQTVNLGPGCRTTGIAIHEIGHAIGLWHEQQRPDRNSYVKIHPSNIKSGKSSNFIKLPWSMVKTYNLPYDYSSIMHYHIYAFNNAAGKKTITPTQKDYERTLGQRNELAFLDAQVVNFRYCGSKCSGGLKWSKCENGGYKNPNKCSECKCPDGWNGPYCETPEPSRPSSSSCGKTSLIASSDYQSLNSPGYFATGYTTTAECSWKIVAPEGRKVRFEFIDTFILPCNTPCKDYVEVRYSSMSLPGPRYCCNKKPTRVFTSATRAMLINFRTFSGSTRQGFRGQYKYI